MKGHNKIKGNEAADRFANIGRTGVTPAPDAPAPPLSYFKARINKAARKQWNERWKAQADIPLARQTRLWFPTVRPDVSGKILCRDRNTLSK